MKKYVKVTSSALIFLILAVLTISLASCGIFQRECTHSYQEKVIAPTCSEEGYTEYTCSECGESYKDIFTQKVAHPYKDTVIAPTCTEEGYTEHTCTSCGDSYTDSVTQTVSHNYKTVTTSPTCSEAGYSEHTCTVCGDTYNDTYVQKIPHTYDSTVIPPICTAEGYTNHTCSMCGDEYNDNYVTKTAHRFNGAACVYCSNDAPQEPIVPATEWYSADIVVFTLTTKEELAGFASLVNSGTNFEGQSVHLGADIDLEFAEWTPIGTPDYPFSGNFDGDNYTISSLRINAKASYVGLFGYVNGSICDFKVSAATVYAEDALQYISIACGYSINEISGVSTAGFLDAKESSYVGGTIGYTTSQISNCSNSSVIIGAEYVGGIAGSCGVARAVYSQLINDGNVTGGNYTGGIIGQLSASNTVFVDNSFNRGTIAGKAYVGGLLGEISGNIGSIIEFSGSYATIEGNYYVGGIAGMSSDVAIIDCSNEGTMVKASSYITADNVFYAYLGGFVGYGYSVENCINNADITYISRGQSVGGIAGYLTSAAVNCENNGNITGNDYVGGIVGNISTSENTIITSLKNTGNITGKASVGGLIGGCTSEHVLTLSNSENCGAISGSSNIGGIGGNISTSAALNAYQLSNSGNITGSENNIGGLFGYVSGNTSSLIKDSSSSANICGSHTVGGLIGYADKVTLQDSTNEGSDVVAMGWEVINTDNYAYLGGYVGKGYKVSGLINNVNITYEGIGYYVGGIIGYAIHSVADCENNGNISSQVRKVGGIAGALISNDYYSLTYKNLKNNGDIEGTVCVGGIVGILYQYINIGSQSYDVVVTTTLTNISNYGNVTGETFVGGCFGEIYMEDCYAYRFTNYVGASKHYYYGYSEIKASKFENLGNVSGNSEIGELIGRFFSDGKSYLTDYTIIGKATVNGELTEGSYAVGKNTSLNLSGEIIYTPNENNESNQND